MMRRLIANLWCRLTRYELGYCHLVCLGLIFITLALTACATQTRDTESVTTARLSSVSPLATPIQDTTPVIATLSTMVSPLATLAPPTVAATTAHAPTAHQTPVHKPVSICPTDAWTLETGYPISDFEKSWPTNFDWTPDGSALALPYDDTVWLATAPSYAPEPIAAVSPELRPDFYPIHRVQWAPDSHRLAFANVSRTPSQTAVWVLDIITGHLTNVIPVSDPRMIEREPIVRRWLDNTTVAFQIHRGTGADPLWQVDTETLALTLLTGPDADLAAPFDKYGGPFSFSPSHPRLVVVDGQTYHDSTLLDLAREEVIPLIPADDTVFSGFLDWAYATPKFLYWRQPYVDHYNEFAGSIQYMAPEIRSVDALTHEDVHILDDAVAPSLSPDAHRVAYRRTVNDLTVLEILDLDTNRIDTLRSDPAWEALTINSDLTYSGYNHVNQQLFWSPDGKYLLYLHRDNEIWMAALAEGCHQRLLTGVGLDAVVWSPNSQALAISVDVGDYDLSPLYLWAKGDVSKAAE